MKKLSVGTLCVCVAIVAAALSGVWITHNRSEIARAQAEKAASRAEEAESLAKKARSEELAAAKAAELKAAEAAHAGEVRKAAEAEAETAKAEAKREEAEAAQARSLAESERAQAAKAEAERETARARAETAKAEAAQAEAEAEAKAAQAKASADAREAERLRSETTLAELKLIEKRQLDLATLAHDLEEYRRELDAREVALRPEKTVSDLISLGEEPKKETAEELLLPENDLSLPRATRRLARAERLRDEALVDCANVASNKMVSVLEKLYVAALKEGRVVDAEFYLDAIRESYPHWKLSLAVLPEQTVEKGDVKE